MTEDTRDRLLMAVAGALTELMRGYVAITPTCEEVKRLLDQAKRERARPAEAR